MVTDREKATFWARSLLDRGDWVILDTETTGISAGDEIVQIAVLSSQEEVLLNTLVRPTQPIPPQATAIHGITDVEVADAPPFPEVFERLQEITKGKTVVIYNAQFDLRLIRQTLSRHGAFSCGLDDDQAECAMLQYAAWFGEVWSDGGYKWQKLRGGDHTALGDCRATLALIRTMASVAPPRL
jgi:DNA polymerase-3 subunit epsilon